MSKEQAFSIGKVSKLLAVPVPTLRSWELRYGLVSPERSEGGHRRYTLGDVERFRGLRDRIARGHRPQDAARDLASTQRPAPDRQTFLGRLLDGAFRLEAAEVRATLEETTAVLGVERTLTEVALAALREVGERWELGKWDVGQEHVATHEVQTWITRQLALAPAPFRGDPLVLACAPEETHSVGLNAFGLVLSRRGWRCLMLGARTPIRSAIRASDRVGAPAIVVSCQWTTARRGAREMIRAAHARGRLGAYGGAAFDPPAARRRIPGTYLGQEVVAAAPALEAALGDRARSA